MERPVCNCVGVIFDSDRFWQVLELGDPRFDGWAASEADLLAA